MLLNQWWQQCTDIITMTTAAEMDGKNKELMAKVVGIAPTELVLASVGVEIAVAWQL